jgi:hypothetical protein
MDDNFQHTFSSTALLPRLITAAAIILAVLVWGESINWHFGGLSMYQIFPLLGLIAYSTLWAQYVAGFLHQTMLKSAKLTAYFRSTGYIVLIAIVLHPGLLIYQRFRDGFGLPPHSYESYVAPSMAWLTLLGSASLLVFLAFELRRWFQGRSWWRYFIYAGDIAMLAIFYHSLRLGTQTHIGWYRIVWWFYGLSLIALLTLAYVGPYRRSKKS